MKWDGDMFLPDKMLIDFKKFIDPIVNSEKAVIGRPKGLTVYKGLDHNFYYKENSFEKEVRIFDNVINNYFEKDILWERFQNNIESQLIESENNVFIEFKDVSTNEFSHWNKGDIGMGIRKRNEVKNFEDVYQISSLEEGDKLEKLEELGFKILDPNVLNIN